MTLVGVGLGPGDPALLTLDGRDALRDADRVIVPGRLAEGIVSDHLPADRIERRDPPMTDDAGRRRAAWQSIAGDLAPDARDGRVAFGTIGDPTVYSTFGHLRRALPEDVPVETIPGVSVVTAIATAMDLTIAAGTDLAIREARDGRSPTGPPVQVLLKVTDVPATHTGLREAGYSVTYGRRLFFPDEESIVTSDPGALADRDYYTVALARREEP
ncbi:MAG: cobalt-factor II C(20)-methyltransferase [Halococcoides sp.]